MDKGETTSTGCEQVSMYFVEAVSKRAQCKSLEPVSM